MPQCPWLSWPDARAVPSSVTKDLNCLVVNGDAGEAHRSGRPALVMVMLFGG